MLQRNALRWAAIPLLAGACAAATIGCRARPVPPPPSRARPETKYELRPVTTPLACVKEGAVYVMDGEGNNQRRLSAPGAAVPESLAWSPDTRRLAFWTVDRTQDPLAGPFRLCVADVASNGDPAVIYTSDRGLGGDVPVFSPNGAEVYASVYGGRNDEGKTAGGLFAKQFSRDLGLLGFPVGGGRPRSLIDRRPATRGPLRWPDLSPDGKQLVAISGQSVAHGHLAIIDLAARDTQEYRDRAAFIAQWCPRALRVAYLGPGKDRMRGLRVWTPGATTDAVVAAGLQPLATFAWSPGGRAIAYTDGWRYLVQVEQRHQWPSRLRKSLRTPGAVYLWPTWTPDGRAIVYEYHQTSGAQSVLKRDSLDTTIAARDLVAGGVRPLFAVSR